MQSLKVRRSGISAEQAAEVIRSGLGREYRVQVADGATLHVRKGLERVRVSLRGEPGGTVFDVHGEGTSVLPLLNVYTRMRSERGIGRRTVAAIGEAETFRDDG